MTPKVPDYGHRFADKKLTALLRRLHLSYRQASINLQQKIVDYLEKFEKEDAKMRVLLDSGELSHEDYMAWRYKKIAGTSQWADMREQLTDDLVNQDKIAASIISNTLPEIYAENHNYGTYEAEVGSGYDTTYTMYDKNTVALLLRGEQQLLPYPDPSLNIPKDKIWNRQHIQSAVLQGILTGESMQDIADRFENVVGMDERAAIRNARTAVTGAENAGRIDSYIRAESLGIKMKQMWLATLDARTRDSHAAMDGEKQDVGKTFSNGCRYPGDPEGAPSEIYNCFIGDTKIATDSEIIRSYKHEYSGEVITIKTARGIEFTCTKNHPILTPNGWIRADSLHKRDDILITFVRDSHLSWANPNVDHVFPRIDTIHELFNKIGSKRTCNLGVNFHGDIPTADVEIITIKRFLRNNRNISTNQNVNKALFKSSNSLAFRNSHFMKRVRRIGVTTFSFVCKSGKRISIFWRRMCHTIKHSLGAITRSNSIVLQSKTNNVSGNMKLFSNGFDRPSCEVFTDNIIDVKISTVSHVPVYNLQTENGYYFINSIISQKYNGYMAIAHNCRCTLVAVVAGADPYNPNLRKSQYLEAEGLTYEEWKQMHGEQFYSKLFKDYEETQSEEIAGERVDLTTHRSGYLDKFNELDDYDKAVAFQEGLYINQNELPDKLKVGGESQTQNLVYSWGINDKPTVLSSEDFDKYLKDHNIEDLDIITRSVNAMTEQCLTDWMHDDLNYISGRFGGAIFGEGFYFGHNFGKSMNYGGANNKTIRAVIKPDAKILKIEDLREVRDQLPRDYIGEMLNPNNDKDKSVIAILGGYDGIIAPNGYVNIINRSCVIVDETIF